jgi:phosphonatase-like hydrolase
MKPARDAILCCRLVVFDMAGTTIADDGHVAKAFESSLEEEHVSLHHADVDAVRGMSKREAITRLLNDRNRVELAYRRFCSRLARALRTHGVREIDGASSTFRRLREASVRTALTTGFDHEIAALVLSSLGWDRGIVNAVVCADDVSRGRPAPDMILRAMAVTGVGDAAHVANVGDTTADLEAAHAAGVAVNIGVLSGAHTRAQLERVPHTHIIESIAAL